jgi:4-hydroxybutyrate dehydrogenase / sulfolactaldehyde 3-reductase
LTKTTIGLIGLGLMGSGLGRNLLKHGYPLVVHDLSPAAVDKLVSQGASAGGSARAVAERSEVVITVLPDGPDVEATLLGPEGIVKAARPGTMFVDCSTVDPAVTLRLGTAVRAAGCRFVDAAMGRQVENAQNGTLMFMVGATDEDFAAVQPVLAAMGTDIIHCGGPAAGISAKVINNLLASTIFQADVEALVIAARAGLSIDMMIDLLSKTAAHNAALLTSVQKVLVQDYEPGFKARLAHKDMGLAESLAARVGAPLFALATTRPLLSLALTQGNGERASQVVAETLQEVARVRLAHDEK